MNFRDARMASGMSQADAGALIGGSRRAVQEWEGGRRNCPPAKLALFMLLTASGAGAAPCPSDLPNTSEPLLHPVETLTGAQA
jgi:transcriptional regulator with XRE-family HTH domain